MAKLLERIFPIPIGFHIVDMANGDKYTTDEDNTVLTPVLAKSDKETDAAYEERYGQKAKEGDSGKGTSFKEGQKVGKEQLSTEDTIVEKPKDEKQSTGKEMAD